jgi:shikimate dehydrogenase
VAEPTSAASAISGSTRVAAVIGHPVRHSRSPALANAAFAAAGLDWVLAALDVAEGDAEAAVAAVRALGLGGLMVTMPHKAAVIPALDDLTPTARTLGAVNSISWVDGALVGHNTDGAGLVRSLRHDDGIDVRGRRCVVLGAGGAARSVVHALADAGAAEVAVLNRTASRAEAAAALAGDRGRTGVPDDVEAADLVVNATSVGMGAEPGGDGPVPIAPELLRPAQVVVDLVYQPLDTPLLAAARARGAVAVDGIGMLVHQAAISISRWTGVDPDTEVMRRAART